MSDYTLLRPAISFYETMVRKVAGSDFVRDTKATFADLQQKYFSAIDNPDYGGNLKKFCYLYKYSVAHGYYIYQALKLLDKKIEPPIFSRKITRIACIGGGPGTELIGIARYVRKCAPDAKGRAIEVTVYDREGTWEIACEQVLLCVKQDLNLKLKFVQFDATSPHSYEHIDFSKYHLVMANFFLSEIRKAKIVGKTAGFWKFLFTSMGPGKVFLAVDFADAGGLAAKYVTSITPSKAIQVVDEPLVKMSCPDSKIAIAALEGEIDHRPKKNAENFVISFITD